MEKVLVGLSGGVDSAATAKILLDEGYEVRGTFLSFCSHSDPAAARYTAEKLGIPFTVVKKEKRFEKEVIRPFLESYMAGDTPNPCVECNRRMKFSSLLEEADRLGIDKVATGHYVRTAKNKNGRISLLRGMDDGKDQSYFLWKLTQKQLSRILFPLGNRKKEDVIPFASGLVTPEERESMEVCFIPDDDTFRFVEENGAYGKKGNFIDKNGTVLAPHRGIHRYTVGQRRGLGVSAAERLFVVSKDKITGDIALGRGEELLCDDMWVEDLHYVSCGRKDLPKEGLTVKGRHRGKALPCRLRFEKGGARVIFAEQTPRFAQGQSACVYLGDELLMGGVIRSSV